MKQKLIAFSQNYVTALRKQLKQDPQAGLQPALGLGREAIALGLGTLELARIHEQALATLELSETKNGFTKLAGIFFTEANAPIVETQRAARQNKFDQAADEKSKGQQENLEESLKLQKRLRQLTHRALLAQEDDRKKISRELQDEVAQTLLGINVRQLTLKTAAKGHTGNLTKEIASTQQLVVESIRSINQFARELEVLPQMPEVR